MLGQWWPRCTGTCGVTANGGRNVVELFTQPYGKTFQANIIILKYEKLAKKKLLETLVKYTNVNKDINSVEIYFPLCQTYWPSFKTIGPRVGIIQETNGPSTAPIPQRESVVRKESPWTETFQEVGKYGNNIPCISCFLLNNYYQHTVHDKMCPERADHHRTPFPPIS